MEYNGNNEQRRSWWGNSDLIRERFLLFSASGTVFTVIFIKYVENHFTVCYNSNIQNRNEEPQTILRKQVGV